MPALFAPRTVTEVSSAPQTLPLAYTTCRMRVSLLSTTTPRRAVARGRARFSGTSGATSKPTRTPATTPSTPPGAWWSGCWAHARRYFWDAKAADEPRALLALGFVQQLYRVEAEAKDLEAEARRAARVEKSRPVLERFKGWLDEQADIVLPKSPIGEAVHYAQGPVDGADALPRGRRSLHR